MIITDEIRNYRVNKALPRELMKLSDEYYALAALKYCYPVQFSGLKKSESPDLQDAAKSLGVEVTSALSQQEQIISGESLKYAHARSDSEREKILRKIRSNGGDCNSLFTSYPVETSDDIKECVKQAYSKKLNKLRSYREKLSTVGLMIRLDIPLFLSTDLEWGEWLPWSGKDDYDLLILLHWSGIDMYDKSNKSYTQFRINSDDMNALKRLGRMAAEGIIKDDDPVWG